MFGGNTSPYLSQMKSDLHETFRITSWGSPKMNQHVKDDSILKVSSQEPSTSSKYDFEDGGFLTHFYSCQRAEIWQTSQDSHIMTIHDVKNDPILQVSSQEPSTSSKYDFEDGRFLAHFYSCKRAEIWHTNQDSYIMIIHDVNLTE